MTTPDTAPIVGWRIWVLRHGRLGSIWVSSDWEAGENTARCLREDRPRCDTSPGRLCNCGFWGLFHFNRCVHRAITHAYLEPLVIGLILGWGETAIHGNEGFRSEYAAVACLFANR